MIAALLIASASALTQPSSPPELQTGHWRAWLDAPLGELPFGLEVSAGPGFSVQNGASIVAVPAVTREGTAYVLAFPHYDSKIKAEPSADGRALDGEWSIVKSDRTARLPFHARLGSQPRFTLPPDAPAQPEKVAGRWRAQFEKEEGTSVGIFRADGARVVGTFATPTGDFGFLEGAVGAGRLRLSTFDGAHAFLFDAQLNVDGTLHGEFGSGDQWREKWTAKREDGAELDKQYEYAHWKQDFGPALLRYVDAQGELQSLAERTFDSKAILIQLVGTWCPNCQDETAWLAGVERKQRARGLAVVALSFEYGADRKRDRAQIETMRARHGADYPFLLAGRPDKALAAQGFPALDRVFAFPTLILMHRDGRVEAVHSGFEGPATGAGFTNLTKDLEVRIEKLLTEPDAVSPLVTLLPSALWRDDRDRTFVEFRGKKDDSLMYEAREMPRIDRPTSPDPVARGAVQVRGNNVRIAGRIWSFDPRANVLLDPDDFGHRMTPAAHGLSPSIDGKVWDAPADLIAGIAAQDALRRRESTCCVALRLLAQKNGSTKAEPPLPADAVRNILPLLDDDDVLTRASACWATGVLHAPDAEAKLDLNLAHGFAPVRREAARALAIVGTSKSLPALEACAEDADPLVREAVVKAVAALRVH